MSELEQAAHDLTAAQARYAETVSDVAAAKVNLDYRRAELICRGIDGKNAEQRDAMLRLELGEAYAELAALDHELTRSRCRLERAQTAFTAVRYKVRLLEVMQGAA